MLGHRRAQLGRAGDNVSDREAALSLLLAPAGNLNEGWPAEGSVGAGDLNDPMHMSKWSPSHFLIEGGVRKQPMLFFGQGDGETQMMRDAPMV